MPGKPEPLTVYARNQGSSLDHAIDPEIATDILQREWGCDVQRGVSHYQKRLRKYLVNWMFVRDNGHIQAGMSVRKDEDLLGESSRTLWDERRVFSEGSIASRTRVPQLRKARMWMFHSSTITIITRGPREIRMAPPYPLATRIKCNKNHASKIYLKYIWRLG